MPRSLRYLKALADPTRLRLARVLARHELAVSEVVRVLGMGQSRISRHLTILAQGGVVESRREGLWVYYRAAADGFWQALLGALEALDEGDGEARAATERDAAGAAAVVKERAVTVRRFFDARAGEWDTLERELLGRFDLEGVVSRLINGISPRPAVAVDVGCGTGALLQALASCAVMTIGVDSSSRMLERARDRFGARLGVELRLGEAEHLPLGDGEADLALMSMSLHHLAEPEAGLREVARVLSPGGTLVLVELERHDREELRAAHGDRWLGFERAALDDMAGRSGLTRVGGESHELPGGLRLAMHLYGRNGGKSDGHR
jgi:ubiquinone/menaquinone biosynthesis C-methylase UbiE